jgi:hypothetical protein
MNKNNGHKLAKSGSIRIKKFFFIPSIIGVFYLFFIAMLSLYGISLTSLFALIVMLTFLTGAWVDINNHPCISKIWKNNSYIRTNSYIIISVYFTSGSLLAILQWLHILSLDYFKFWMYILIFFGFIYPSIFMSNVIRKEMLSLCSAEEIGDY